MRRDDMAEGRLDALVRQVLVQYPAAPCMGEPIPLRNAGGFSGARLWRVPGSPSLYLRAWPPSGMNPVRLRWLHGLMRIARVAGLSFVPTVLRTEAGSTWVEHHGRLWELT